MNETEFLKHYISNASQLMWFLGAGTSRTAGMPAATDIIWDLKIRLYCLLENQEINNHDLNNETIRKKIQSYFDGLDYPPLWDPSEYSFYFEKTFGSDYSAQQRYLSEKLNSSKISLNAGHKILAGLIAWEKAKLIFTTNFDEVIETAYAKVSNKSLPTFHLEGTYAALKALNQERFPIYAKIHGDFKYQSIKNLSADLLSNDLQIQNCFLAAAARYGLVVSGYSGRDANVMDMFGKAIRLHNAFPTGLFWTVTDKATVLQSVSALINEAQQLGINAHIVETRTFDIMLSKIWRSIPEKPEILIERVNATNYKQVSIPLTATGTNFPVIRTNAIPIVELPSNCAIIKTTTNLSYHEIKELVRAKKPRAVIIKTEHVLGWGNEDEFTKTFSVNGIESIEKFQLDNAIELLKRSTHYKAFFERALVVSLCDNQPLKLRNTIHGFYIAVDADATNEDIFTPLKSAVGQIAGSLPNGTSWQEAVEVKLELKCDRLWLMITPTIWIEPDSERRNQVDFMRQRKLRRYNKVTSTILDAWIKILLGANGKAANVELLCYKDSNYPAQFIINTRSAYSRK